ncbi:ATP-binding protein [Streptomyces sp. NPDC002187]|uniref:ATP-binding protein n=1 Tax=Streptomyces sp. NPDC002187 TaxID=3364637 RepID=UPI00368062D4
MSPLATLSPDTLREHVPLPDGVHAPAAARHAAESCLGRLSLRPERRDEALLIVSELVTNAVRHASGPRALVLTAWDSLLDIAVSDRSEVLPVPCAADRAGENGGFGLALVRSLGATLIAVPEPGGKTVHAVLSLTRPDAGGPNQ